MHSMRYDIRQVVNLLYCALKDYDEWEYDIEGDVCGACGSFRVEGHGKDCRREVALKAAEALFQGDDNEETARGCD